MDKLMATAGVGAKFVTPIKIGKKKTPPPTPATVVMMEEMKTRKIVRMSRTQRGNKDL